MFSDVGDAAVDGMSDDLDDQFSREKTQLLSAHDKTEDKKECRRRDIGIFTAGPGTAVPASIDVSTLRLVLSKFLLR